MEAINITAYTDDDAQIEAIKAIFKAMKIKFELSRDTDASSKSPYNADFVAKVQQSKREYKNGDYVSVDKEDLKSFLGLE